MALNRVTFRTRALTSLVFVGIILIGLLWNQWSFFILFSVIHFGCWVEYQKLVGLIDPGYQSISSWHRYGVMLAGWCIMLALTNDAYYIGHISLNSFAYWLGLSILLASVIRILIVRRINLKNISHSIFGLIYISLSLGLFVNLRVIYADDLDSWLSLILVLMIIASLWINDTMAYLIGSWIGKTPLTKISPKKTWEGTIGGILMSILVMTIVGWILSSEVDWNSILKWTGVAAICSIVGTIGDLFQSKLKRMAGVKDSGHIMPGHGGFLDRFDSLLFAAPFVWIFVKLFA
jgi:phosphatidate cytidylyltransferase